MQTPTSTDTESPVTGGDGTSQIKSRATEIGRKAAAAIDDKRDAVARGIDAAASSLHEKAESLPGGEKIARAAHSAAETMEKAAGYVRDQDLEAMFSDVKQIAKRHPGAILLTAAALGFLLARSISRR